MRKQMHPELVMAVLATVAMGRHSSDGLPMLMPLPGGARARLCPSCRHCRPDYGPYATIRNNH